MIEETGKMTLATKELQTHWANIAPLLTIRNKREYNAAVKRLNELLDEIGNDETHPLYSLLDTLGTLIHIYEEKHYPIPDATGAEVLRFLMEEHGLTQSDLSEVGSQGVVSEILNGKRELNVRQIRFLAEKFKVSRGVFFVKALSRNFEGKLRANKLGVHFRRQQVIEFIVDFYWHKVGLCVEVDCDIHDLPLRPSALSRSTPSDVSKCDDESFGCGFGSQHATSRRRSFDSPWPGCDIFFP